MISGTTASVQVSAPSLPLDKGKKKEVQFDKALKKDPSKGFKALLSFDKLAQLANIPARITLHELLHLLKEKREKLRDALADSESFLTQVPAIPTNDNGTPGLNVIWCSDGYHPLPSHLRTFSSKIISMIDLCTVLDTLALHALK